MCEERGYGTYTYKTGNIIQIVDGRRGYNQKVHIAGKPVSSEMLQDSDDPTVAAMWIEIGCPTPRQMGFDSYCEEDAIRDQFEKLYPGVDIEKFVTDKISYHGGNDSASCDGEVDNPSKCKEYCDLQDFVESAKKRGVTVKQIFRDRNCRCKPCRMMGF